MTEVSKQAGISRRTIVKGAAWSVPVIAAGPALPAFAYTPPVLEFSGKACKIPGQGQDVNKGYVLGFSINNGNAFDIEIRVTAFTILNATSTITPFAVQQAPPTCALATLVVPSVPPYACYPPNETLIAVYLAENGNSQNAVLQFTYEVYQCSTDNLLQGSTTLEVPLSGDPTTGGCEPHPFWYDTCFLPAPPVVTEIEPATLPVSGGPSREVTITGGALGTTTTVTFGSSPNILQVNTFSVKTSDTLTFTVPDWPFAAGPVDVGVINAFGSVTLSNAFGFV